MKKILIAVVLLAGVLLAGMVCAESASELFDDAADYTVSDIQAVEIDAVSGRARLKSGFSPYERHDTGAEFEGGIHSGTQTADLPAQGGMEATVDLAAVGLLHYWAFAEGAGDATVDAKGSLDGSLHGAVWVDAKFAKGLNFDGSSFVSLGDMADHAAVTITAWVKPNNLTGTRYVFGKILSNSQRFTLYLEGDRVAFAFGTASVEGATAMAADRWQHIAASYDSGTLKVYLNGVLDATAAAADLSVDTGTEAAFIGGTPAGYFKGQMDDVAVFGRALHGDEIEELSAGASAVGIADAASLDPDAPALSAGLPGLLAYWPFDKSSGGSVPDMVGASTGAVTSPAWMTSGAVNANALSFTGATRVSCGGALNFGDGRSFSISAWFKRTRAGADEVLLAKRAGAADNLPGYMLYFPAASGNALVLNVSDGTHRLALISSTKITDTDWHHVTAVFDADDISGCRIYLDGVDDSATTDAATSGVSAAAATVLSALGSLASAQPFMMGTESDAEGSFFVGSLDEVSVWGRVLSVADVVYLAGQSADKAAFTSQVIDGAAADVVWGAFNASLSGVGTPGIFVPTAIADTSSTVQSAYCVRAADVDSDGDRDIVLADWTAGKVYWLEAQGAAGFTEHVVISSFTNAASVDAADVDGDGDIDLVAAAHGSGVVTYLENDGSQSFASHVLTHSCSGPHAVKFVDLDQDRDLDILVAADGSNQLSFLENDGGQIFTESVITTNFTGAQNLDVADLDADGDLDLAAVATASGKLAWFRNDGNETFAIQAVTHSLPAGRSVCIVDVNSDGDPDIVAAGGTHVVYLENNAGQGFSESVLAADLGNATHAAAQDLDGDGDIDIVVSDQSGGEVVLYKNDASESFTASVLKSSLTNAHSLTVADLNGDGDPDILAGGDLNAVTCLDNQPFEEHVVAAAGTLGLASGVVGADLDHDGDMDIVAVSKSADDVSWFENDGTPDTGAWTVNATGSGFGKPSFVKVADINGDGNADIVVASVTNGKISWLSNNGSWTETSVATGLGNVMSIALGDLDGDGDTDIAAALDGAASDHAADEIAWWENTSSGATFTKHSLKTGFNGAAFVCLADLDEDGGLDVVGAAEGAGDILWFTSGGTSTNVETALTGVVAVATADLDLDGDLDIIAAAGGSTDSVTWYENGGSGASWTRYFIASGTLDGAAFVAAADMDADGDVDVLAAAKTADEIVWWANDGSPADGGWIRHILKSDFDSANAVAVADIDGDGDPDVLGTASNASALSWWEQKDHATVQFALRGDTAGTSSADFDVAVSPGCGVSGLDAKRYLWYRAELQRSDSAVSPLLQSVKVEHVGGNYATTDPYVQTVSGVTLSSLTSFDETATVVDGSTAVKYQVSPDGGSTWYYYSGGWQTATAGYSHASSASVIDANAGSLDAKMAANGAFKFRAYLHSENGTQTPELTQVSYGYTLGTIALTSFKGGGTYYVGKEYDVTWNTSGTVGNDFVLDYTVDGANYTTILTGVTASVGRCSWTVDDIIQEAGTPESTVRLRIRSAGTHSIQSSSSSDFSVDKYTITWQVKNADTADALNAVGIAEVDSNNTATSRDGTTIDSGQTFEYTYGTYTTTFSASGYADASMEDWTTGEDWTPEGDAALTLYLESDAAALIEYACNFGSLYDAENASLLVRAWFEKNSHHQTNTNMLGTCTVEFFDEGDAATALVTLTDTAADANGFYEMSYDNSSGELDEGKLYNVKVTINYNGNDRTTLHTTEVTTQTKIFSIQETSEDTHTDLTAVAGTVSTIADDVSDVKDAVGTASDDSDADTLHGKLESLKENLGTLETDGDGVNIHDRLTDLNEKIVRPLRLLHRTLQSVPGGTCTITFKSYPDLNPRPTVTIYNDSGSAVLPETSMTQVVASTATNKEYALYQYKWDVRSDLPIGDYTCLVYEATYGSVDSMTIQLGLDEVSVDLSSAGSVSSAQEAAEETLEEVTALQSQMGEILQQVSELHMFSTMRMRGGQMNVQVDTAQLAQDIGQQLSFTEDQTLLIAEKMGIHLRGFLSSVEEQETNIGNINNRVATLNTHLTALNEILGSEAVYVSDPFLVEE